MIVSYQLNQNGITFFADGVIVFDCPLERIKHEPEKAIKALQVLEKHWRTKYEILAMKGGEKVNE